MDTETCFLGGFQDDCEICSALCGWDLYFQPRFQWLKKRPFRLIHHPIIPCSPWYHAFWLTLLSHSNKLQYSGILVSPLNKLKSIRDNLHHESPVNHTATAWLSRLQFSTWSASRLKTGSWFSWEGLIEIYQNDLQLKSSRELVVLPLTLGEKRIDVMSFDFFGEKFAMEPTLECSGIQPPSVAWAAFRAATATGAASASPQAWSGRGVPPFSETPILTWWKKKTPQPHGAYSLQSALHTLPPGMMGLRKKLDTCVR